MIVTTGNVDVSSYMTQHTGITNMHLTGSDITYENIVYGSTLEEKDKGKKTLSKVNKKPFTTELGNVTPFIIHPGTWSSSEIKYQARKIVTAKLNNNGFNCIAAQVVVLPKGWKNTNKLVSAIKNQLSKEKGFALPAVNESDQIRSIVFLKLQKHLMRLSSFSFQMAVVNSMLEKVFPTTIKKRLLQAQLLALNTFMKWRRLMAFQ